MSNQEILEKAIQKAIEGGWLGVEQRYNPKRTYHYPDSTQILKWRWEEDGRCFSDGEYDDYESVNVEAVIFDHEFAKALWGDSDNNRKVIVGETDWHKWPLQWQYHLQQMVVAADPIAYLAQNI